MLTYVVLSVYYVQRNKMPLPLVQLSWRFILASIVMGLFAWICTARLSLFVLIPAAVGVYLAMLWLLHAFSSDDVTLFKQILGFSRKAKVVQREPALIDPHD